jgi:hypothetical protein
VTGTEGQKHDLEQETILPTTQLGKFNRFAATEAPKQKVQRASLKEADEVCQTNRKKSRQDHTTFQWILSAAKGWKGCIARPTIDGCFDCSLGTRDRQMRAQRIG